MPDVPTTTRPGHRAGWWIAQMAGPVILTGFWLATSIAERRWGLTLAWVLMVLFVYWRTNAVIRAYRQGYRRGVFTVTGKLDEAVERGTLDLPEKKFVLPHPTRMHPVDELPARQDRASK